MKRLILFCLLLAVAAGAQAQYVAGTIYRTSDTMVFPSGTTLTLEDGSTVTLAETLTVTLGADEYVRFDASSTAQTQTAGAVDVNFASVTANTSAINVATTQNNGTSTGVNVYAMIVTLTGNDADGDVDGIQVNAAATANAAAGTYEYGFMFDCAENTAGACIDGLLVTSTGASSSLIDGVDVSDSDITNAVNIGSNLILGGNSDSISVGATNNALTVTADSTNTPALIFADAGGAADGLIDTTGAGAITIGSADVTKIYLKTDGGDVEVDGVGITPSGITADTTAGTWVFTKTSAGGGVISCADDAGAATCTLDTAGAGSIDVGSADVTDIQLITDGGSFDMGTTANAASIIAAAGQTATLILADDAGAANGAVDVAGAGAITIGSADVTAVTITTDSTGDGTDLVLPENGVSGNEAAIPADSIIFCGENNENGTVFMGPALAPFLGDGSASYALTSAGCDALDAAAEGDADLPITGYGAFKVTGLWCTNDATLGAGETIVYTVRSAVNDLTPTVTCTISTGETYCRSVAASTTDVAAGATVAVKVVQTSDNADADESWCRVYIQMQ